ncbi:MAG: hypothetical protein JWQ07_4096 [Ramlibacter sp.]|nr:hypothetical protein [Ramlibacter sp.]
MNCKILRCLAVAALAVLLPAICHAQAKRVALVIGNATYRSISPLHAPTLDAATIGQVLDKSHGFKVITGRNLGRAEMLRALTSFAREARGAESAVIYYSGHGVSSAARQNFLLPVDVPDMSQLDDVDLELGITAISVDEIVETLARTHANVQVLVVDACRDIPNGLPRFKSLPKGMAPAPMIESRNMLVVFATESGRLARDGTRDVPSPYAGALAQELGGPGASTALLTLLDRVALRVEALTGGMQRPMRYGNLRTDMCLTGRCSQDPIAAATPSPSDVHHFGSYTSRTGYTNIWTETAAGRSYDSTQLGGEKPVRLDDSSDGFGPSALAQPRSGTATCSAGDTGCTDSRPAITAQVDIAGNAIIGWTGVDVELVEHYVGHGTRGGFIKRILTGGARSAILADVHKNGGRFNLKLASASSSGEYFYIDCNADGRTQERLVGIRADCSYRDPSSGQLAGALVVSADQPGARSTAENSPGIRLGRMRVKSSLGEPVDATLELNLGEPLSLVDVRVRVVPVPGIGSLENDDFLAGITAKVVRTVDGRHAVEFKSATPVASPFIDLALEVTTPNAQFVRDYTLIFDPSSSRGKP